MKIDLTDVPPGPYSILVVADSGTLPAGLQLSINTPLADGPVVLNATDQDLVTNTRTSLSA